MKILLTGVTGYIGQRLLPVLLEKNFEVVCCVRDKDRFNVKKYQGYNLTIIEVDFLNEESLQNIPKDVDVAYYLIHSMSTQIGDFGNMEEICATNFKKRLEQTNTKQVIYLSGISNTEELSKHLSSRKNVETILSGSSFALAKNLVNSMKVEVICKPNSLAELLNIELIDYDTSIKLAFDKIEQNQVLSSWKFAQTSNLLDKGISNYIEVPINGCFVDVRTRVLKDTDATLERIWRIGGKNGWYYGNLLWKLRGFVDQIFGGVGMRRGRRSDTELQTGDALDFWRVLLAKKEEKRLLLYAEMKLPGEAWLEFSIDDNNVLTQTATFRPLGLFGRMYWYTLLPFHGLIFNGMINKITTVNDINRRN